MAFPASSSSGNLMLSLKIAFVSTGVLCLAVMLKVWVPLVTDFAVSELPIMYSSVLSWLRPPYLYLVINCIIISIVASSKLKLQQKPHHEYSSSTQPVSQGVVAAAEKVSGDDAPSEYVLNGGRLLEEEEMMTIGGGNKLVVSSGSVVMQDPHGTGSMEMEALIGKMEKKEREKPLLSARFGHSKKSVKASPEPEGVVIHTYARFGQAEGGKAKAAAALRVSKPRRHDTLESTWKTITEGRPMPLSRHLKKSDTWDSQVRRDMTNDAPPPPSKMKKSETVSGKQQQLTDRSPHRSGKLRREPSLSQDELNRRVEAFINKFNEEMRLQRQESLNQYQEMLISNVGSKRKL